MRHYLILLIWFVLFQAEICETEIKENLISEALEHSAFEPKYFTHSAAAAGDNNILDVSNEVHETVREVPGYPCWTQFTSSPKLPAPPSQLSYGNAGIHISGCGLGISVYSSRCWSRVLADSCYMMGDRCCTRALWLLSHQKRGAGQGIEDFWGETGAPASPETARVLGNALPALGLSPEVVKQ